MKNMSAWAIRHPVSPVVLFVVLLFMGLVAFVRLPVTLNPDVAFPLVHVNVSQPGAAPQEIETQVIQKIEGSVAGVGNIHNITSLALEGTASTWIEFQIGTPIDRAVADVRDAVAKVRSQLPNGIQEPIVQRVDVDGGPIAYYAVKAAYHSRSISLTTSVVIAVLTVLIAGGGTQLMKRFFPEEESPEEQKS